MLNADSSFVSEIMRPRNFKRQQMSLGEIDLNIAQQEMELKGLFDAEVSDPGLTNVDGHLLGIAIIQDNLKNLKQKRSLLTGEGLEN